MKYVIAKKASTHGVLAKVMAQTSIALCLYSGANGCFALSNSAKVPILLYHSASEHVANVNPCEYSRNASQALARDLETIHQQGYVVAPVPWIAEWIAGIRNGSTLPNRVVGITFDDGPDFDWFDSQSRCSYFTTTKSMRRILQEFKSKYPELFLDFPYAVSFVVGSPKAREVVGSHQYNVDLADDISISDSWWSEANHSRIIEIHNHSTDHDHPSIKQIIWDPALKLNIAVGGYGDSVWAGQGRFDRIDSEEESRLEVVNSAQYIYSKTGAWPKLFAYPFGQVSSYLQNVYFPNYEYEHHTLAAFCVGDQYATRNSSRFCIPRFTHGDDNWNSPNNLTEILIRAIDPNDSPSTSGNSSYNCTFGPAPTWPNPPCSTGTSSASAPAPIKLDILQIILPTLLEE